MASTSNYALRLPASLKKAVEAVAREDGTTINQFIVSAVAEKLSALKTADYFAERAARAGIGAFEDLALDTYADERRFFSYRRTTHRQEPDYGRLMSAIVLN